MGPRAGLGVFGEQKNLLPPNGIRNPDRPSRNLVSAPARPFRLLIASLGEFAKLRKVSISFVVSVRLSSWNIWAPTGRILKKFDISVFFFEIRRELSQILLKSDNNNEYFT